MKNSKDKQNKIIYMCLILLLVTASVLVAVASGAAKREKIIDSPLTTGGGSAGSTLGESAPPAETQVPDTTNTAVKPPKETEEVIKPSDTEEVISTVDDIVFVAPTKGAVLVPCSATPIYSVTMNDYRAHEGVDITGNVGDAVVACADGAIAEIWDDPMMGRSMRVTHAAGVESVYQNLSDEMPAGIEVGKAVTAGELIGAVGESALIECEEEPHLHFELKVGGVDTDPTKYITLPTLSEEFEG